jgi:voltage-gated potassium channel
MNTEKSLSNHTIVCGAGPNSTALVKELARMKKDAAARAGGGVVPPGNDFIVVDQSEEALQRLCASCGECRYLVGDVTDDDVLERVNVEKAFGIFTLLASEKDNIYVAVAARQRSPSIRIVSSTADPFVIGKKLTKAGASAVVSPNFIGGLRLVSEMARPSVTAFLDELLQGKNPDLHIQEIVVKEASSLNGCDIKASDIYGRTGLLVIAILQKGETSYIYNPPASTLIRADDTLVVFGGLKQIGQLQRMAAESG